jgi:exonuclease III
MDPTKILIWNVRGLNSSTQQDYVRTMVQSSNADIVYLQETKMSIVPQQVMFSMLGTYCVSRSILDRL